MVSVFSVNTNRACLDQFPMERVGAEKGAEKEADADQSLGTRVEGEREEGREGGGGRGPF